MTRLRPEDRGDFEAVPHMALNTQDVRDAVRADPTGRAAVRLRIRAFTDADEITLAAEDEYRRYLALDSSARQETSHRDADGGILLALAVLTPLVAGSSAAALLVLGYVLRLADAEGPLPGSLVTVGWALGLLAAVSALIALTALLVTGVRGDGSSSHPARLEHARQDWRQALLTQGMLPHLRRYLNDESHPHSTRRTKPACSD